MGSLWKWPALLFSVNLLIPFSIPKRIEPVSCFSQNVQTGWLVKAAHEARRNGQTEITIPLPVIQQRAIISLDEEMRDAIGAIVEPIASASILDANGDTIDTWYKVKLIQVYARQRLEDHEDEAKLIANMPEIPRQLLPLGKGEILISFVGGTSVIDGVTVNYGSPRLKLSPQHIYFVLLCALSVGDGTKSDSAFITSERWSAVFTLDQAEDKLVPLFPNNNSAIQQLIVTELHGRLHELSGLAPKVVP